MKAVLRAALWLVTGALLMLSGVLVLGPERPVRKPQETGHDHGHEEGHEHAGHAHGDEDEIALPPKAILAAGVRVEKIERRPLAGAIRATGTVVSNQDRLVHVTPRIRGRIEEIDAPLGQDVERGQVLAVLDSVELGTARAGYLKAQAAREAAEAGLAREERLMKQGISTEADLLAAKAAFLTADAERRMARETLLLYGLPAQEVDALSWDHDDPIGHCPIRAPSGGTIVQRHMSVGEVVGTEDRILTIADLSTVWVLVDVFPRDLGRLRLGQPAECRMEGVPGAVRGTVTHVADFVRAETRTIQARVEIDNRARRVKPGMFVTALLFDAGAKRVLALPRDAIQSVEGRSVAFVQDRARPGRFRRVEVTLGSEYGPWREVLKGLEEGDDVVVSGAFILKSELLRGQMGHQH